MSATFSAAIREFGEFKPHVANVCLLAMTRSNTLNITINHKLISWSATLSSCQM